MAITAAMVKELREMTSAGMADCKKALTNTDGDMDKAVEWLKENGLAKADKKAGRIAAEGIVCVKVSDDGKRASIVEVNSETDFVAKNDKFQTFVAAVAAQALDSSASDMNAFMAESWIEDGSVTVEENLKSMIATIGENMNIRRFEKLEEPNGVIVPYIHAGGKIGVLVKAEAGAASDAVTEILKNVAMQVAAMSPKYLSTNDVSDDYKKEQLELLKAQAKNDPKNASKPDEIIEKMVTGRLNKELKEVCLLEQTYVKAEKKENVGQYVEKAAKDAGTDIKLTGFIRFETGEGLEKKEEDFAAEVAAQIG
ncbi:MAG: translation elongation factor Ts [Eubacterium sp.]|nr:translation elongation factor Ts [Eubacterium sp.]